MAKLIVSNIYGLNGHIYNIQIGNACSDAYQNEIFKPWRRKLRAISSAGPKVGVSSPHTRKVEGPPPSRKKSQNI